MSSTRVAFLLAVGLGIGGCGSVESDPCGSEKLCIGLRVEGQRVDLDQLVITIDNPAPKTARSPDAPSAKPIKLPAKVALHLPAGTSGRVDVSVLGLAGAQPVAYGAGAVMLDGNGHARLTVQLHDEAADLGAVGGNGGDLGCVADLGVDPMNCGSCGNVCASGSCGSELDAPMSTLPSLWTFNAIAKGGASYDAINHVAVLTQAMIMQAGSIVYQHPIQLAADDSFDLTFDFQITFDTNTMTNPTLAHADGFAFVMIKDDPTVPNGDTAVGPMAGSSLGMVGPQAHDSTVALGGFGVEFDTFESTYNNADGGCGEPKGIGEHINIDTLDVCQNEPASGLPTPVATPLHVKLADNLWHNAHIRLAGGALSVWVDGQADATANLSAALPGFAGGLYHLGFTGATGSVVEEHAIRNVHFTFASPRCL